MANRGSESNSLLKTLNSKMTSSANDQHYAAKYWLRFNPKDSDNTFFGKGMARLFLLPIWLPYWYWNRQKKTGEMRAFVAAGTSGRLADDELRRELVLKWVDLHPRDFVLGKYDPNLPKLEDSFQNIFSQTHEIQPSNKAVEYIETGTRAANIQRAGNETGSFDLSVLPDVMRIVGKIVALGGVLIALALVFVWLLS